MVHLRVGVSEDGRQDHIQCIEYPIQISLIQSHKVHDLETWYVSLGLWPIIFASNIDSELTLTYFMATSNLFSCAFIWGKTVNEDEEKQSRWPE